MIDHNDVKLGKQPARVDLRVPLMARYLTHLEDVPEIDNTFGRTEWPMLGNGNLGNCTSASKGHGLGIITELGRGKYAETSEAAAIKFYEDSCDYNPRDPSTDQGGNMLDVARYLVKHGYNGWRFQAFGRINLGDIENMSKTISICGFADIGISLPESAKNQKIWDVPKGGLVGAAVPGSWGGHDAIVAARSKKTGLVKIITWDGVQLATEDFIHAYVDEMYGYKSNAFLDVKGFSPNHLTGAQIEEDMVALAA